MTRRWRSVSGSRTQEARARQPQRRPLPSWPEALWRPGEIPVMDDLDVVSPSSRSTVERLTRLAHAAPRIRAPPRSGFWPKRREGDHLSDVRCVGEDHHEPVDAHPEPAGRRKPTFQSPQIVLVDLHRLFVASRTAPRACASKRARWSSGSTSSENALPSSRPATIGSNRSARSGSLAMATRKRRDLRRELGHVDRPPEIRLDRLLVELEQQLPRAPRWSPTSPPARAQFAGELCRVAVDVSPRGRSPRSRARPSARGAKAGRGREAAPDR